MFNAITEQTIREVPQVAKINIERLPQELTRMFAEIVSIRRTLGDNGSKLGKPWKKNIKTLRQLANNLETLAVVNRSHEHHRSVCFVAATAHHLLLMIRNRENDFFPANDFSYDAIPSAVSSILLFLIGNSPADAAEIASKISLDRSDVSIKGLILKSVCYLANGKLENIIKLDYSTIVYTKGSEAEEAENYLWELIFKGIQSMAGILLGNQGSDVFDIFRQVLDLSIFQIEDSGTLYDSLFSGPRHLAQLFILLSHDLFERGVVFVSPPDGTDSKEWSSFMHSLAKDRPYLWENHYDAIQTGFLNPGISAVLTFPTGAGKTTLSELKIASALMNGRSVIYLVPTHALEDQVKKSLQKIFPSVMTDLEMEIGLEYTEAEDEYVPEITVMTPERCLTKLSIEPEAFSRVGLVVFDEFHLISGKDDKLERRNLDAMFCLIRLFGELPEADYLLISAMVENAKEISSWIESLTGRVCISFDSGWKPTRQLHGCVLYQSNEIDELRKMIRKGYQNKETIGPPKPLGEQMLASAWQIFSLRNMWDTVDSSDYLINQFLTRKVKLKISPKWALTSNRNEVAADLAVFFAEQNLKVLMFVDNPVITQSTVKRIDQKLSRNRKGVDEILNKYERNIGNLTAELGDIKYSYFVGEAKAAVHHGMLLPIERRLNEQVFKDKYGVNIVVATATLAQGINLPAEVVIIAGDDRFDEETDSREILSAHEILNAAGRAGRAGTSAQGVVLLIPGDIVTIDGNNLSDHWWQLKKDVFSKSDQCLMVSDPLQTLLDEISSNSETLTADQKNIVFRLNVEAGSGSSVVSVFNRSFAAFKARAASDDSFDKKVKGLIKIKEQLNEKLKFSSWISLVSFKMGIDPGVVAELGEAIDEMGLIEFMELDLNGIVKWMFGWLQDNTSRVEILFSSKGAQNQLSKVLGLDIKTFTMEQIASEFHKIMPLVIMYMQGENFETIDKAIPGKSTPFLNKGRNFILKMIPHISYAFSLISIVVREKTIIQGEDPKDIPYIMRALATFIKEGFDNEDKLRYRIAHPWYSRVQVHKLNS